MAALLARHHDSGAADARAAACRERVRAADGDSSLFGWLRRLLTPGILLLAALIFCYRFGDQLLTTLLVPFLIDRGLGLVRHRAAQGLGRQRDEHRRRAAGRLAGVQHRPTQCVAHQRRRASGVVHAVRRGRARRRRHRPAVGRNDRRRRPRHDGDGRAVRADDGRIGSRARRHRLHAARLRRARGRHDRKHRAARRSPKRSATRPRSQPARCSRCSAASRSSGCWTAIRSQRASPLAWRTGSAAARRYTIADFGNWILNVAPSPSRLCAQTRPPMRSTALRTSASPMPVPGYWSSRCRRWKILKM